MTDKLLTVIVPSYNMERYLRRGVESLLAAPSLRDCLDVIVVNDGSTDRTSEIGHELQKQYPSTVRIVDKSNGNYGSCVNRGLKEAKGRYVRILDADDAYDPGAFTRFVDYLRCQARGDSVPDVVFNDYSKVDDSESVLFKQTYPFPTATTFGLDKIAQCASSVCLPAITYRTEILRKMNYHQTEGISYTDNEYVVFPMLFVQRACYFPETIYRYLIGREGQTIGNIATVKSMLMYSSLFDSMSATIESIRSRLNENQNNYLSKSVRHLIAFIYRNMIRGLAVGDFSKVFLTWDEMIRVKFADHYAVLVDPRGEFYVKYLSVFRRCRHFGAVTVCMLATLRSLWAVYGKVRRSF